MLCVSITFCMIIWCKLHLRLHFWNLNGLRASCLQRSCCAIAECTAVMFRIADLKFVCYLFALLFCMIITQYLFVLHSSLHLQLLVCLKHGLQCYVCYLYFSLLFVWLFDAYCICDKFFVIYMVFGRAVCSEAAAKLQAPVQPWCLESRT